MRGSFCGVDYGFGEVEGRVAELLGVGAVGGVLRGVVGIAQQLGRCYAAPVVVVVPVQRFALAGPFLVFGHHLDGEHYLSRADLFFGDTCAYSLLVAEPHTVLIAFLEPYFVAVEHCADAVGVHSVAVGVESL